MEQGVVVVGLCADRIECSPVEVAELLNELVAEVGALLVLLIVVKVDLPFVSRCASAMLFNRVLPGPTRLDKTRSQESALRRFPLRPSPHRPLQHSAEEVLPTLSLLDCSNWGRRCGWL